LLADEDVMVKSEPVDMTDYYAASQIQVNGIILTSLLGNAQKNTSSIFICSVYRSVGDPHPEPDPQDPHVVGPPGSGSGSISQSYGSGSGFGSFPFLINVVSWLK
jgi:hypothetical protein